VVELVALRQVAPRPAALEQTRVFARFHSPAERGLVLSQRDKTHLLAATDLLKML
jgi:hypothetical protein